jgi:hypothetical protein
MYEETKQVVSILLQDAGERLLRIPGVQGAVIVMVGGDLDIPSKIFLHPQHMKAEVIVSAIAKCAQQIEFLTGLLQEGDADEGDHSESVGGQKPDSPDANTDENTPEAAPPGEGATPTAGQD